MNTTTAPVVWDTNISPRRRERTAPVEQVLNRPDETYTADGWVLRTYAGGGVGNSYGYTAVCEIAVAVTDPAGTTVVFRTTDYANNRVSQTWLGRLLPGTHDIVRYDSRWAAPEGPAVDAAWAVLREYHSYAAAGEVPSVSPANHRASLVTEAPVAA